MNTILKSNKGSFKVGDSVRFTEEYRSEFRSTDREIHIVGRIDSKKSLITFKGQKKVYEREGRSGDDGYVPVYSSHWLELAQ